MFTHQITRTYTDSSGSSLGAAESITDNTELNFDAAFTHPITNGEIDWTATAANLKSVILYSDKAVTLKTNSSGSPQETISLAAGVPLIWSLVGNGAPQIPFSDDVTKIFLTTLGAGVANFKIRALADQTV